MHLLSRIISPGETHPVYYDARWVDGGGHASPYLLGFGKFLSNFCVFFQRFYQTFVGLLIICLQVVTSETNVEVLAINLAHKCASLEDAASKTLRASKLEKEISLLREGCGRGATPQGWSHLQGQGRRDKGDPVILSVN